MTIATDTAPLPVEHFNALTTPEAVARYRAGVHNIHRAVLDLPDALLDTFFRPDDGGSGGAGGAGGASGVGVGRWSCRALIGHLADAEIVFTHRLRRAASEDNPLITAWDPDAFIDAGLYADEQRGVRAPVAGFIAVIHTTRAWTAEWLDTLPEPAWSRRMLHERRGEFTIRTMLDLATWHLEHHAWFLHRKLARLGVSVEPPHQR